VKAHGVMKFRQSCANSRQTLVALPCNVWVIRASFCFPLGVALQEFPQPLDKLPGKGFLGLGGLRFFGPCLQGALRLGAPLPWPAIFRRLHRVFADLRRSTDPDKAERWPLGPVGALSIQLPPQLVLLLWLPPIEICRGNWDRGRFFQLFRSAAQFFLLALTPGPLLSPLQVFSQLNPPGLIGPWGARLRWQGLESHHRCPHPPLQNLLSLQLLQRPPITRAEGAKGYRILGRSSNRALLPAG